ncbi:hypothetical protein ACF1BN_16780 [Streptomyces sp. NPDC014861]|uniref:hypothetical protein n=1 Tax=Streptomyces sp. NPDC014861 TaxID=3364923 RepID=UPI0036F769AB
MDLFLCAGCGAELSVPVERVALPVEARYRGGHSWMPPLMDPGTYAVDPEPSGHPWRSWEEADEEEAAAAGVYAPVWSYSAGPRHRYVLAPGDTRGTRLVPERSGDSCLGVVGGSRPTLLCAGCGLGIGVREDDCGIWNTVRYEPHTVLRHRTADPAPTPEPLRATPPITPDGNWSPHWTAAAGVALAHLLAASEGRPLALPAGPVTALLGPHLDRLLPAGPGTLRVALAGPGIPADGADLALVPSDRRTGRPWAPPCGAVPVGLPGDVWAHLALPPETSPMPISGHLPPGVLRDDYPLPDHPRGLLAPDRGTVRHTLARLPRVREPWLRALYNRC